MRVLVVGAGAIGGYFGGRLLQSGQDITFLVRPKRAAELASDGLVIKSPGGDVTLKDPPTVLADGLGEKFDVVLLSCKSFDLEDAIKSFAPAVGPNTAIIPLLNGMSHLDVLDRKFGKERVLGGLCAIAATLNEKREVVQLAPMQSLGFGERAGGTSDRVKAIAEVFAKGNCGAAPSEHVMQDMWEKWVALATLAGSTCLMRAAVGDIVGAPAGTQVIAGLFAECAAIATSHGHAPRPDVAARMQATLLQPGSTLTASMLRDVERNGPTEADHILGDLLARRGGAVRAGPSLLEVAYAHLKAHDARRVREAGSAA